MTGLQLAHVTPLFVSLHWLPVAACIQFKTLMLAYRTTTGSAPTYYESTPPPEVWDLLVSDASWYHHREAQNHSRAFSFTIPGRWNDLPIRDAGYLSIFKQQLKTHLFQHYLKKQSTFPFSISSSLSLSLSLSFSPSLASLYLFEQCLRLGVTSTSSVCLPLQDESFYVFPNCKLID